MEMSFFLRARRRMACGFALALALSGPVVAAPPAIPISYTEALQRALANAPTLQARRSRSMPVPKKPRVLARCPTHV